MNIYALVTGVILLILGFFGVGKNQRKNQWIVRLFGVTGYKIFLMSVGVLFIVLYFLKVI